VDNFPRFFLFSPSPLELRVRGATSIVLLSLFFFSGNIYNVSYFKGKLICQECINIAVKEAGLLPELPATFINQPAVEGQQQTTMSKEKRQRREGVVMFQQLIGEVAKDPNVKQSVLANRLGISTPYVSLLLKKLKQQNMAFQEAAGSKENT
jgi:hypothetical protein